MKVHRVNIAIAASKHSRGVALVTVLLIVSLVTIAAVSMARQQFYDTRRTSSLINGDQAHYYAQGAEIWAGAILARDRQDSQTDHLGENWAYTLPPIDLPGGGIKGQIQDLQGRLNINNLVDKGKADPSSLKRLQRLLSLLELDASLAQAIVDWIDSDIEALPPSGAEDDYYIGLEQPYLTANRPMASISELRLIKDIDQEIYTKLEPHLTALPGRTSINLNTASAELIASISPDISLAVAQELVTERDETPFDDIEAFSQHPSIKDFNVDTQDLAVSTDYFNLYSETQVGNAYIVLNSLLFRAQNGIITVLQRGQTL